MLKYRYGSKKHLIFLTISILLSALVGGASLFAIRFITDAAVSGAVDKLVDISKLLLIVIVFQLVLNVLKTYLKSLYMNQSMKDLRLGYVEKLFDLDIKDLNQQDENIYLSQLSNDADRYEERFYLKMIELMEISAELAVSMLILATVNLGLLMIAIVMLIFFISISKKTSKPVAKKESLKSKSLQKYTNYINETLSGFFIIKQNSLEKNRILKFKELASQVQKDNYEVDKKSTQVDALNSFIQMTIILTMILAGLLLAKRAGLSLGTTLIAGTAFSQSIWPMQNISPYISQMSGISVVLKDYEQALSQKASKSTVDIERIENVSFNEAKLGYNETIILDLVNVSIEKNEKVLIVGSSGAGKSTILKTLRRQLPLKGGSLLINNHSLNDITVESYFKQLSVVDQIGFIFNASLITNITLGKKENLNNLDNILKAVGLSDVDQNFILKNNGSNLSGGQRARLLLARALYLDTSLIICDEIFASLDKEIGQNIEKMILSVPKTVINVSHIIFDDNLALYDKIYLVENNSVSEIEDLLKFRQLSLFV